MKQNLCELCWNPAKLYCESDRANLCWDCDLKVHGVNFLVTRHRRTLLCHACQNPTPWRASGSKLTPSVSVCGDCAEGTRPAESTGEFDGGIGSRSHGYDCIEDDGYDCIEDDDYDGGEDEDDDEDEDDKKNQVVPRDSSFLPVNPIPVSSSSEEESSNSHSRRRESIYVVSRKRHRPQ